MKKPDKSSPEAEMLKTFEAAGLVEYLEYLQSGKRIMATNFKAGVAKGLGLTLGMSLVVGGIAWVLALLVDLPLIGEYAGQVEDYMNEYRESTNYTDDFQQMNELLRHIEENTEALEADVEQAVGGEENVGASAAASSPQAQGSAEALPH